MNTIQRLILAALVPGAAALAAAPAPAPSAPITIMEGTYTAPVPSRLAHLASFTQCETRITERKGKRVLEYSLPEDLVGKGGLLIVLEDKGAAGGRFTRWEGTLGSARCTMHAPMTCLIHYPSLPAAFSKVEKFLREKYKEHADVGDRVEVARIFLNPLPETEEKSDENFLDGNGEAAGILVGFPRQ